MRRKSYADSSFKAQLNADIASIGSRIIKLLSVNLVGARTGDIKVNKTDAVSACISFLN